MLTWNHVAVYRNWPHEPGGMAYNYPPMSNTKYLEGKGNCQMEKRNLTPEEMEELYDIFKELIRMGKCRTKNGHCLECGHINPNIDCELCSPDAYTD